jgi:hypothetical protein
MMLRIIYVTNILVAGAIAYYSITSPSAAATKVFSGAYQPTVVMQLVGCLWLAIAILSLFGIFRPMTFSPALLLQVIYKGMWLLVVALPAILNKQPYPAPMAVFFVVWVVVLPFAIPWSRWWAGQQ